MFILLLLLSVAKAEYRVFELVIQNQNNNSERTVISSLDPFQYPGYYDLGPGEIVLYRDTWMCWGDTGYNKSYCAKPEENETPNQSPVSRDLASP